MKRRRRRTVHAAALPSDKHGQVGGVMPAGQEMSGSPALPRLGAGKTPALPKPGLVSPPRPVPHGEKHLTAGGRHNPAR